MTVNSEPNNLFARIHSTQGQAPIAIEYGDAFERVIYTEPAEAAEVAEVDSESWGEQIERVLEVARERASENQDNAREAWQHAEEDAREAQERAREAYAEAMENYHEAMRAAEERTRSAAERVVAERRAQDDRRSWSQRSNARSSDAQDRDAGLASRIDKLEAAARARGIELDDGERSLEERVAQLEELTTEQQRARSSKPFTRMAPSTPPPTPRVFRLRRSNELAPSAPVAPTPPVEAAQPPPAASPFWLGAAPMAPVPPSAPAQGAPRNEDRARMEKAMTEMKRDAARLREELNRMRAQIESLPREDGSR